MLHIRHQRGYPSTQAALLWHRLFSAFSGWARFLFYFLYIYTSFVIRCTYRRRRPVYSAEAFPLFSLKPPGMNSAPLWPFSVWCEPALRTFCPACCGNAIHAVTRHRSSVNVSSPVRPRLSQMFKIHANVCQRASKHHPVTCCRWAAGLENFVGRFLVLRNKPHPPRYNPLPA